MLQKLIHKIALSCEQATLLMERKRNNSITPQQKIRLKLHLAICKYCKIYSQKLKFIDQIFTKKTFTETKNEERIDKLKERIKEKIK